MAQHRAGDQVRAPDAGLVLLFSLGQCAFMVAPMQNGGCILEVIDLATGIRARIPFEDEGRRRLIADLSHGIVVPSTPIVPGNGRGA